MWSHEPNILIEKEKLLDDIVQSGYDGVTILGGEPLEQFENLSWLLSALRERKIHIMLYTGFEENEIRSDQRLSNATDKSDILVIGRYENHLRDTGLQWRGSSNQIIEDRLFTEEETNSNEVEIVIDDYGKITIYGYPDKELMEFMRTL